MGKGNFSKINFHSYTFCIWNEVPFEYIKGMKISYTSKSKSQYIFTNEGIYRISNHWGRVANCHWRIIPIAVYKNQKNIIGFANWTDFYSNDDVSKSFYIKVDWKLERVNFFHKNDGNLTGTELLLNAKETAKKIRLIKDIFTTQEWAKYLNHKNIDDLRKEIVTELITTSHTFIDIKKKYFYV